MKPPGKTTLDRMVRAAQLEAERIEITQDFWVADGRLTEPLPEKVALRDDFAGIVRLIDAIMSDKVVMDRLQERMSTQRTSAAEHAIAAGDEEVTAE